MNSVFTTISSLPHTAVLFLVFNRPEVTKQVFEVIRRSRPARFYVAADGARKNKINDIEKVQAVREYIMANIDWDCDVKTLFRDINLGCKKAVSEAITWFFKHEEQGIILEDDCLPHPDFFFFCQELLERYKDDDRVSVITGNNFQNGIKRGRASYYFSKYNHCWGWASWRRSWEFYDGDLLFWPEWQKSREWEKILPDLVERQYWAQIFDRVHENKIDSWAYPWTASVWYKGGLTATPNVNLVCNIGFGDDSTHTSDRVSSSSSLPVKSLGKLTHPEKVYPDAGADRYVFNHHFGGTNRRWYNAPLHFFRRVARKLYGIKDKISLS